MKLELTQSKYDELVRNWVKNFVEDMEVNDLREYVRDNLHHNLENIRIVDGQAGAFGEMVEYGGEEFLDDQLKPFHLKLLEL